MIEITREKVRLKAREKARKKAREEVRDVSYHVWTSLDKFGQVWSI